MRGRHQDRYSGRLRHRCGSRYAPRAQACGAGPCSRAGARRQPRRPVAAADDLCRQTRRCSNVAGDVGDGTANQLAHADHGWRVLVARQDPHGCGSVASSTPACRRRRKHQLVRASPLRRRGGKVTWPSRCLRGYTAVTPPVFRCARCFRCLQTPNGGTAVWRAPGARCRPRRAPGDQCRSQGACRASLRNERGPPSGCCRHRRPRCRNRAKRGGIPRARTRPRDPHGQDGGVGQGSSRHVHTDRKARR